MRIDLHQHIWTESLLDALERRDRLPFVRRAGGLTTVHSVGEQPYIIDTALDGADALESIGPVLERIAARHVPLFVHPGPGRGTRLQTPTLSEPLWWRALTDYVTQMQSAWLTITALGRRHHPELTILFAMLAGCAPLQYERLGARGGPPPDLRDPRTFYDTSSYGPDAVATISGLVGPEQLVYGSDRPVVEHRPTGLEPVTTVNGSRVLQSLGVLA